MTNATTSAQPGQTPRRAGSAFFGFIAPGLQTVIQSGLGTIRFDLLAGITLAAYLLPSNIGYASLAGVPPQAGIYTCIFAGLVFWLFCSTRQGAITITSSIAVLLGSYLGSIARGDAARYEELAAITALIVGLLALIAWMVRAGSLVNFLSETVLIGFKAGVALQLGCSQLPQLFGFKGTTGNLRDLVAYFLANIGQTRALPLALGLGSLAALFLGRMKFKHRPVALIVMITGIIIAVVGHLGTHGVNLLGDLPQGLPILHLPTMTWRDLNDLLPLASACFLLSAVETAAVGRTFAVKYSYRLDSNQEFLALAAANLAAGLGGGLPVGAGTSQSLVNESAGARTSLSGLFAACFVLLVAVFLTGLISDLPQAVLAAIVFASVAELFSYKAFKRLWQFDKGEFAIAMVVLAGVMGSGILRGVLAGVVISVIILLRRSSRPHTTELGRVPGSDYFADRVRHPENLAVPGVFVFRADTELVYFNVQHVYERFLEMLGQRTDQIRLAIYFLGTCPMVDLAGADMLTRLFETMKSRGIVFRLAEAHGDVRDALRRAGFQTVYGHVDANQTVAEVIAGALPSQK
jgi:SulP family sulfate permease